MKNTKDILILSNTFDSYSPTTLILGKLLEKILISEFNIKNIHYEDIMGDYHHSMILKIPKDIIIRFINSFKLIKYLNDKRYSKIILIDDGFFSLFYIFPFLFTNLKNKELIVFRYDLSFALNNKNLTLKHKFIRHILILIEKFFLLKSNKIIHKGLKSELEFTPYYKNLLNKPQYLFREFINSDLIQDYDPKIKLSYKDNKIHIVHVGAVKSESDYLTLSIFEVAEWITRDGVHFHIYSNVDNLFKNKLKEYEKENKYFHYEGFLNHSKLIKEITKYDYGTFLNCPFSKESYDELLIITATGNKMFDYLTAKLPIICLDNMVAMVEFIDQYKVGFYISQNEITKFHKIVKKRHNHYEKMITNINKAIIKLTDTKNFINFIKK